MTFVQTFIMDRFTSAAHRMQSAVDSMKSLGKEVDDLNSEYQTKMKLPDVDPLQLQLHWQWDSFVHTDSQSKQNKEMNIQALITVKAGAQYCNRSSDIGLFPIYVLDTGVNMKRYFDQVKSALEQCLIQADSSDRFSVITFSNKVTTLDHAVDQIRGLKISEEKGDSDILTAVLTA